MPVYSFMPDQFLRDLELTADAIDAAYSPAVTRRMLEVYEQSFRDGAVLWRATDKPGGALNYRFYERRPVDTVGLAVAAGLFGADNEAARLISSWSALYPGESTQLCDFDAARGLVKTWVYLGGMRPLDDILAAEGVPARIRGYEPVFRDLGLEQVRHVAVDYQHRTANLYFRTPHGITRADTEGFATLAESSPPDVDTYTDIERFTAPDGFTFSVTMSIDTGSIERVGYYALKLPAGQFPAMGPRLTTFFQTAPSRDEEEMNAVAWSFGGPGRNYLKAERSYCGELVALMRQWNSPMTDAGGH